MLAFSEFFFFNEGSVRHFLEAPGAIGKALHISELILFYCLPGSLLLALEPMMTTWPRTILAGAFVGWSIEAAMVPVAYENVPFSFFWTSVSWHALIDVCLGWVVLRRIFGTGKTLTKVFGAVTLGCLTALWSTWAWADLALEAGQFAEIIAVGLALQAAGYLLSGRSAKQPVLGRTGFWFAIGINLACWALWAAIFLPVSIGLLVLATLNGLLLMGASAGESIQTSNKLGLHGLLPLLLALPGGVLGYWMIKITGYSNEIGELAVLLVAFGGILIYAIAAISALRDRVRK
ncbi:hypothetical protein L0664_14850 [Octadecabacter sp. G9-8]|uniref:Uncharacterized protein n=1 Tax=Octadecabacter dasysiphoniae TaxID=2909341 RepID=A0ABS9CZK5_9RHOB|nr:hypothetical protein [Octadecabacter dasysiphoniae]MCF2872351.1 hypothetical protein [Octadecabacter dasysiphoniae]